MNISLKNPIVVFLLGAGAGYVLSNHVRLPILKSLATTFGFSGPIQALSPDVKTTTCTPAGYGGPCGAQASYCNPECACGVDCADARVQYCKRYAPGGVCLSGPGGFSGPVASNQGLPGQGPIVSGGFGDILNAFGWGAAQQSPYAYQQYGYQQQPYYGYQQPQYNYGYQQPYYPPQYGYSSPQPYSYPPPPQYGYSYPSPYGYMGKIVIA